MKQEFKLGLPISEYMNGQAQMFTLVVTEECNLRCKYCYQANKNSRHVMPRDIAFKAIDFILDMPNNKPGLILEFTGGEPTLEIDLVNEITEYFKQKLYRYSYHPWQSAYTLMLSTNGTLYQTDSVQQYLWKNREHSSPALTIDGVREKHNRARVFADGSGSYDLVLNNAKIWIRQYPHAVTKMTFDRHDIPYLSESIIHVWSLGIKSIAANPVFERKWELSDANRYESELHKLADISIEEGYWRTHNCNIFWLPADPLFQSCDDRNWCGAGTMLSVDSNGNLYPCVRFHDFCLANKPGRKIGDVFSGLDLDLTKAFRCLRKSLLSPKNCQECLMDDQCSWCVGHNYDVADSDTIFQRSTLICEMHKARWRANKYYWSQLEKKCGVNIQNSIATGKFIDCQR